MDYNNPHNQPSRVCTAYQIPANSGIAYQKLSGRVGTAYQAAYQKLSNGDVFCMEFIMAGNTRPTCYVLLAGDACPTFSPHNTSYATCIGLGGAKP